ncbi:flavin reductase family protein [Streptomyces sp. NPDC002596]
MRLIYCCGPAPLLDALETACATLPPGTLRTERFTALDADPDAVSAGFEVELADSGQVLQVPADKSILDVMEEAGIEILSSCREGTCGTCETGVLSGTIDHRDVLLTSDERAANDVMFVCVSRTAPGCSRLVLDCRLRSARELGSGAMVCPSAAAQRTRSAKVSTSPTGRSGLAMSSAAQGRAADVRMTCSWNSPPSTMPDPDYRLPPLHPLSQDIQQPAVALWFGATAGCVGRGVTTAPARSGSR